MSGECEICDEHTLECKCKRNNMKRWISIGDYILNPEYFNVFYMEEVHVDDHYEWHLVGEDKHQVCWRLLETLSYKNCKECLYSIRGELEC